MSYLQRVIERIKSLREGRTNTEYAIETSASGVCLAWRTMENETGEENLDWSEIEEVETYKVDLITVDCICVSLVRGESQMVLTEDMNGWQDFLAALSLRLDGFPRKDEWYAEVLQPAFDANQKTLWKRSQ